MFRSDLSKQAAGQIRQQSPSSAALRCPDSLPWLPPLPLVPISCVCIPTSSTNSPYSSWPRSKVHLLHESSASKAASSTGSHNTLSVPWCHLSHHFLPHNSLSQHVLTLPPGRGPRYRPHMLVSLRVCNRVTCGKNLSSVNK